MEPTPVQLQLPATLRHLNILSACISELLVREEGVVDVGPTTYSMQLAAQEICANIVNHAYLERNGWISATLTIAREPHRLIVELHDTGLAFDPSRVPTPNLEEPNEGGYGLFLARELLDDLCYETKPTGNTWRLVKRLDQPFTI